MRPKTLLFTALLLLTFSAVSDAQKVNKGKPDTSSGSSMDLTIAREGQKTEIRSTQYSTHDGYIMKNPGGDFMIFFGASSSGDGPSFSLTGQLKGDKPGTYAIGGEDSKAGFNLQASILKGTTMLMPQENGEIVITSFPLAGGFVTGSLHATCQTVTEAGTVETYDVSGTFRLIRR